MNNKFSFLLIFLFVIGYSQVSKKWEKGFYGVRYNVSDKILYYKSSEEIIAFGLRFEKEKEKENKPEMRGLLKLDKDGNLLKELHFGTQENSMLNITQYGDSQILLVGYKGVYTDRKLHIQIRDLNLNLIREKIFEDVETRDVPKPSIQTDNNKNIIVSFNNNKQANILKLDSDLNLIWQKNFQNDFSNESNMNFESLMIDENEDIIAIGNSSRSSKDRDLYDTDILILKTDKDGNLLWKKTIGSKSHRYYAHSITNYKNSYYISGRAIAEPPGKTTNVNITLVKISYNGNIIFNNKIGGESAEISSKIISNNDGTFYISGQKSYLTGAYSASSGKSENLILKVNTDGKVLNNYIFGTSGYDGLTDMAKISDNHFILLGNSNFNTASPLFHEWKVYSVEIK